MCRICYSIHHFDCSTLAYCNSSFSTSSCIVLSSKSCQDKTRAVYLLISKSAKNLPEKAWSSNSFISHYALLAKSFCSYLTELDTPVFFWESVVCTEFVFAVIAFKRQILLFSTIRTIKFHKIIRKLTL